MQLDAAGGLLGTHFRMKQAKPGGFWDTLTSKDFWSEFRGNVEHGLDASDVKNKYLRGAINFGNSFFNPLQDIFATNTSARQGDWRGALSNSAFGIAKTMGLGLAPGLVGAGLKGLGWGAKTLGGAGRLASGATGLNSLGMAGRGLSSVGGALSRAGGSQWLSGGTKAFSHARLPPMLRYGVRGAEAYGLGELGAMGMDALRMRRGQAPRTFNPYDIGTTRPFDS